MRAQESPLAVIACDADHLLTDHGEFFEELALAVRRAILDVPGSCVLQLETDLPTASALRNASDDALRRLSRGGVSLFAPALQPGIFCTTTLPKDAAAAAVAFEQKRDCAQAALLRTILEYYIRLRDCYLRNPELAMVCFGASAEQANACVSTPLTLLRAAVAAGAARLRPRLTPRQILSAQARGAKSRSTPTLVRFECEAA